jgi:hypothetical protein
MPKQIVAPQHVTCRVKNPQTIGFSAREIKQRIIDSCIQLVLQADCGDDVNAVTVLRLGSFEVRLSRFSSDNVMHGVPRLWLEAFSHVNRSCIDSYGCSEFDEADLEIALDLILHTYRRSLCVD